MNNVDDSLYNEYVPSLQELYEDCVWPTIAQSYAFIAQLCIFNLAYSIIVHTISTSEKHYHVISTIIGLCYIYLGAFPSNAEALHIAPMIYVSYVLMFAFKHLNLNSGHSTGIVMIIILITYEFGYHDHAKWLEIKSVFMIAMMKIMSIAFDLQDAKEGMLSIWSYSGYIWCPANSVLGPWISYKDYVERFNEKPKYNLQWIISIGRYLLLAFIYVTCSNCIVTYIMPDNCNIYVLSFRDALTFRLSHYFISHLASATMVVGSFRSDIHKSDWKFAITNPSHIEAPRSLVSVVINWNIPTHTFLKKYIFASFLRFGSFAAVLATYAVSSMLHGLNVEVSLVLLSLGIFSFIQFKLQDVVAAITGCCVRVRPCRNCNHANRPRALKHLLNLVFAFITIVYLAFTGCLMYSTHINESADVALEIAVAKWRQLHYYGLYLALGSVVVTCILS